MKVEKQKYNAIVSKSLSLNDEDIIGHISADTIYSLKQKAKVLARACNNYKGGRIKICDESTLRTWIINS